MLAVKRSAGVAPEVNLRQGVTHTPLPNANKAAYSGFETQRRRHQKSKTGVSVAPQKGLMSSKKFLKIKKNVKLKENTKVACERTITIPSVQYFLQVRPSISNVKSILMLCFWQYERAQIFTPKLYNRYYLFSEVYQYFINLLKIKIKFCYR